jgi:hypothetical protein
MPVPYSQVRHHRATSPPKSISVIPYGKQHVPPPPGQAPPPVRVGRRDGGYGACHIRGAGMGRGSLHQARQRERERPGDQTVAPGLGQRTEDAQVRRWWPVTRPLERTDQQLPFTRGGFLCTTMDEFGERAVQHDGEMVDDQWFL